jgi:hypothetical protein
LQTEEGEEGEEYEDLQIPPNWEVAHDHAISRRTALEIKDNLDKESKNSLP